MKDFIEPIPIIKGDGRVKINGQPPLEDCRIVAEDQYQKMIFALNKLHEKKQAEIYTADGKLIRVIPASGVMAGDILTGSQTLVRDGSSIVASVPQNCIVIINELGKYVAVPPIQ